MERSIRSSWIPAAAHTIFDVDLESHLGKATRERSLPGGVVEQIKTYQRGPELRLGRVRLPKEHGVECGDLTAMRHICARDFYGVLGVDYLRGLILRIDFERKRASVLAELPGTKAELGERLATFAGLDGTALRDQGEGGG